ncbi:MAG: 3-hydroxyacyl-CoA dehydrogenase/enoyl-CoA hydratase/3-hydroxybutyryl-CoA epimerase, partial [Cognaticolwellia sp.]
AGHAPHPAKAILEALVATGRTGRAGGAGFYDYVDGRRQGLWSGLWEVFELSEEQALADGDAELLQDLVDRMLYGQAIGALQCFEDGVLLSPEDGNIGSILGIGFPAWTGGVVQFVDQVDGGIAGFVTRCGELEAKYGKRFTVPEIGREILDSAAPARQWLETPKA